VPDQPVKPLILAVDTTHEYGSLALARGDELIEVVEMHAPTGFAHVLYAHLSGLLERRGVAPSAIDCFATASGPGSFTGVRVGLACIKGLAEATGRPAVGVSNLEALARFGSAAIRAVVIDARRGDVYGAAYDEVGRLVIPEVVTKFAAWLELLAGDELEFVSTDFAPFREEFARSRFHACPVVTAPRVLAGEIARIAAARFCRGEAQDPAALDANYVRRSDAELFWKEQ